MFRIVKLKHDVLWKSLRCKPLMRVDNLFYGNWSSNVKPDSLSSTQMKTLLLALKGMNCQSDYLTVLLWILSNARQRFVSPQKKICRKKETVLAALTVFFYGRSFSLMSPLFVSGIIRQSDHLNTRATFTFSVALKGRTFITLSTHKTAAHSHITLIRTLWEVIPLTLPLKEVHCRHERGKTNHIYYLRYLT